MYPAARYVLRRIRQVAVLSFVVAFGFASIRCTLAALAPPAAIYKTTGNIRSLAVTNGLAYLGLYPRGFEIVSVRDPTKAQKLGALSTGGPIVAVAVDGSRAYISESTDSLARFQIIDVADPSNPKRLGTLSTRWTPWTIAVRGNVAFIEAEFGVLSVIDVSDPANPKDSGVSLPLSPEEIVFDGEFAYIVARDTFRILDISEATNLKQIGLIERQGALLAGLAVSGNYAYVVFSWGRSIFPHLSVFDVSDPKAPQTVASYPMIRDAPFKVALWRNRAFVSGSDLFVFDISDRSSLTLLNNVNPPPSAAFLAVSDDKLFVSVNEEGLYIFDLSVPVLSLHSRTNSTAHLTWSGNGTLRLQKTASLSTPQWVDLATTNSQTQLDLAVTSTNEFFRLLKLP